MSSRSPSGRRVKVGVVGCGLVAQVMHLPYLRELSDRFDVAALCDISPSVLGFAASRFFPDAVRTERWEDLLARPIDAVLVLTPGSHAPTAVAAAEAGLHVFVEKPMCFAVEEGLEMIEAAERAGRVLMVGYMKRYDPAFERLLEVLPRDVRLARISTLESPLEPYVAHYPLCPPDDVRSETLAALREDDQQRVTAAIGTEDAVLVKAYRTIVLDSMVHELNAVRAAVGEPTKLEFASVWGDSTGLTATVSFGETKAVFAWVDLPGIARYEGELAFFGADERATVRFPSPFLRSMPTELVREGGERGTPSAWRSVETISYEEAFKRELVEFHEAIVGEREARTPGTDALRDIALGEALVRSILESRPIPLPTFYEEREARALH